MRHAVFIVCLALCAVSGCTSKPGREVQEAVSGMGGASASGSGATLVAPPAAAEPSEQIAVEEVMFEQDTAPTAAVVAATPETPDLVPPQLQVSAPQLPADFPLRPVYKRSQTYTRLGAQQDVSPMLKQAGSLLNRLNKAQWLGLAAIVVAICGLLHSAGNKEGGYPAVWVKVLLGGVVAVVMGDALWFWVLIAVAGLLYLGQKLGVIKYPPIP